MSGHTKTRAHTPQFMPIQLRSEYYARSVGPLTLHEARAVCRLAQAAPALLAALKAAEELYNIGILDAPAELLERVPRLRKAALASVES